MSSVAAPSNGRVVTYPPCQPWCFYQPEDHDQEDGDYCHLAIGRGITGLTLDGDKYELSAMLVVAPPRTTRSCSRTPCPSPACIRRSRRGAEPYTMSPADFDRYIRGEVAKLGKIVKESGAKAE